MSGKAPGRKTSEKMRGLWRDVKRSRACYAMTAPFMILFVLFTVVPVVMSLPIGFTDFDMINPPSFVGLDNYTNLFFNDRIFIRSIRVTIVFALITGPVSYALCFLLAWLINELPRRLRTFFTLVFYAPSMVGAYTVWQLIFSGDINGYVNAFLIDTGIITKPVQWLTDGRYVLGVTIIVQLWISLGAGFLALRAGFQNIDPTLYEAGAIDGIGNRWQKLIYIVLPSMKPQLLFAAVMQIVSSFTAGRVAQDLVGFPSTDYKAHTIMTHAWDYGWVRYEMGYASAICMVLFLAMYLLNKLIGRILKD